MNLLTHLQFVLVKRVIIFMYTLGALFALLWISNTLNWVQVPQGGLFLLKASGCALVATITKLLLVIYERRHGQPQAPQDIEEQ